MNNFLNDYNDMGHEKVYERLLTLQKGSYSGYGSDELTDHARKLIEKELGRSAEIEFVAGGTIANIVCATANLRPYEAVLCAGTGHIVDHETGSIEATGHKVVTISSEDGKLYAHQIEEILKHHDQEINVRIGLVYISQTTELGTVYTKKELEELYELTQREGLILYIDGARLGVSLAATSMTLADVAKVCDIFTIGGTKNGAIYGEALVILREDLQKYFRYYMKQRGAIMAKTFVLGATYEALFEDGLYYELGQKSYDASRKIVEGLKKLEVPFLYRAESNQIFLTLEEEQIEKLKEDNLFEITDPFHHVIRLVTNYRTTEEEIQGLLDSLEKIL